MVCLLVLFFLQSDFAAATEPIDHYSLSDSLAIQLLESVEEYDADSVLIRGIILWSNQKKAVFWVDLEYPFVQNKIVVVVCDEYDSEKQRLFFFDENLEYVGEVSVVCKKLLEEFLVCEQDEYASFHNLFYELSYLERGSINQVSWNGLFDPDVFVPCTKATTMLSNMVQSMFLYLESKS